MTLYAGIDLHSTNSVLAVIDEDGKRLHRRRYGNDIERIVEALAPFKDELGSVVVESTFNWYWLVDGLQDAGHSVQLAHPPGIDQYSGLKHGDDDRDAEHLANLARLGLVHEGFIFPRAERALRDLLRQRLRFVQQSVTLLHSIQSLWCRMTGTTLSANAFRALEKSDIERAFPDLLVRVGALGRINAWKALQDEVETTERCVLKHQIDRPGLALLKSAPGIGNVLGLTALLETGPVTRFASVGEYASYCRMVDSVHLSNGKKKGEGNRKSGNRFLCWAYIEAAHYAMHYEPVRVWYQRKLAKSNLVKARKAVAHKIARGCYQVLRDRTPFDIERAFG
jgi:transposase